MPTIQIRRKTKAQWTSQNPILAAGEIGYEADTNSFKIGDGTSLWGQLKAFVDSTTLNGVSGQADTVDTLGLTGAVGRAVMKAADAVAARAAMGAGSSDLALGTTSTTAKAGNYVPAWSEITAKPTVIGAGSDAASARAAIGAGTSNLALGTTSTTAKAGNYVPAWSEITSKPAVIAAGSDAATARSAIGAGTSNLALGTSSTTAKAGDYKPAVSDLTATGTRDSTTYLRGDNTWGIPSGTGLVLGTTSTTAKAGDYRPAAADLTATGTRDATTFLRGDNVWVAPSGGGGVSATGYISVKAYGAVGDGTNDDTTAIANAYQACVNAAILGNVKALYFPSGFYKVTALPSFQNYTTVIGDGQRATTILYEGTGTLCTLPNRQECVFRHIGVWLTGVGSIGFDLSNCFGLYFHDFCIRGQHATNTGATFRTQVGMNIRDNTGNTQLHHFNFNNLGIGLRTRTIMNHLVQGKFSYCYTSILGTGGDANAGLYMDVVEFDSSKDATTTRCHLDIDGGSNTWSLSRVWFEGGNQAMIIGRAGVGGPQSFFMSHCKVAGRAVYADFQHATMITLEEIEFNPDQETPAGTNELQINATYCPIGKASFLMTTSSGRNNQMPRSFFPSTWIVEDRFGAVIPGAAKTVEISQTAYTALATKDASTLYVITS